ncbi:MAG: cytochrome P450 [Pseudomonadota bacterium]
MTFDFDPHSPEFAQNPHGTYTQLREIEEPVWLERERLWLLSRYDDVAKVAESQTMIRSLVGFASDEEICAEQRRANWHDMPYHERYIQFSLLDSDGDLHRRLRKFVFGEFTNINVSKLRPYVEGLVGRLLARFGTGDEINFTEELAAPVPGHVIGRFLGVPDADCPQLRIWSEDVVRFFDVDRTAAKKATAEQATRDFHAYLVDLTDERRKAPKDDLISSLLSAHDDGRLSEQEYISTCMLIVMAGHGSTIDALGSGLHSLLRFPDEMELLKRQPDLAPSAVQEMVRFESPLPFFHRFSTEETEVAGRTFPAMTKFGLLYGSANRDETVFDNAATLDITRMPNRHIAFGRGPHLCLGNHLSRMNMAIIFNKLLEKFPEISLVGEPTYRKGLSVRGPEALQVRLN